MLDKLHPSSGVSSVVINYYLHMDANKYSFDFMVNEKPETGIAELIRRRGGNIYVMPELRAASAFSYPRALDHFFVQHPEHEMIHGHIANAAVFYLGMAKKHGRPHRLLHSHNTSASDITWKKFRNKALILPINLVCNHRLACSRAAAGFLFGIDSLDTVKIIPNAVNLERFAFDSETRLHMRMQLGLENRFVVGHVGRFCAQKNHGFLLQVFARLLRLEPTSVLLFVGDGELRSDIERKVSSLGIQESVRFLGIRSDVPQLMQAMDVFLLPSLFEGLPVVGVEAQAAGLPSPMRRV